MAGLASKSPAAKSAVTFITVGALMIVWSGIWYVYLSRNVAEESLAYYLCAGFFLSGTTLLIVGFGLGRIGRAARESELPPVEAAARNDEKAGEPVQPVQQRAVANPAPLPTVQSAPNNGPSVHQNTPVASNPAAPRR